MDNSTEEQLKRTLICKNIPASLLKRQSLKEHFEKFGTVVKLQTSVEREIASVEYETHQQAAQARLLGTSYQSHQIQLSWKKKLARTSSAEDGKGATRSPPSPRVKAERLGLFGKAISSATGKTIGTKQSLYRSMSRGHSSGRSHTASIRPLWTTVRPTGVSSSGPVPCQQTVRPAIKTEPAGGAFYDDLPPDVDWSEENILLKHAKALKKDNSRARKPSVVKKNPFVWSRDTQPTTTPTTTTQSGLFGQISADGSKPEDSEGKTALFGKIVKKEPTSMQPTDRDESHSRSQSPFARSGQVLFGKPSTVKGSSAGFKTEPKTANEGGVVLFGTKLQGGEDKFNIQSDDTSDTIKSKGFPTLFLNAQNSRAGSPKPSILDRFSNRRAQPPRASSASPTALQKQRLPLTTRRSPSPAGTSLFKPPDEDLKTSEVEGLEWIMPASLAVLRQTAAYSCSERQAVLDKREKLIRLGLNKESDLSKAKATRGCCPDMCPERERYIREERRRVHVYEMIPNTESHPQIDHSIAVKEYSRSSADQEEPLPLELRPDYVLARTMEYLCNNIMGKGMDSTWGDWYDFLWNRTRAIRKDITQQHLCNQVAAGLVEKCVRFHIYCGARLVEEDAMTFDTKINDENLTKCLQTLKEMYADMLKRDVVCDSEAEFRAYYVLMNLNEGDTLREVQQLRPEVRNSKQINFALSAYAALSEKNYIKFFKLVKETTFLNACILHRYFNQIRSEALKIILRAYSGAKGAAQVSCKRIFAMLYFEDHAEGSEFLNHFGISNTTTAPSRDSYVEPESSLPFKRAPQLVEDKMSTSLGEAVYGAPLPPNVIAQPISSFDERGYFIGIIRPPGTKDAESRVSKEETTSAVTLPPAGQIPPQVVKDCVKLLICGVTDAETRNIIVETMDEEKQLFNSAVKSMQIIAIQVVDDLCKDVAVDVMAEERRERDAKKNAEQQRLILQVCSMLADEMIEEVQREESIAVAKEVYRGVEMELLERQRIKCADAVGAQLIHSHVVSLVEEIGIEVYQSDVVDRLEALAMAERRTRTVLCKRVFNKWLAVYKKRTHIRRAMIGFPAAPPMLPQKRSQEFKVTKDTVQLGKRSRLSVGPPGDMNNKLELSVLQRMLSLMLSNTSVNMSKVVASALADNYNGSDYMKLIVLNTDETCEEDRQLRGWLTNKLSAGTVPTEPPSVTGKLLSNYSINVDSRPSGVRKFNVCIRSCQPLSRSQGFHESLYGANMAMVLLPYSAEPNRMYWKRIRAHLMMFLQGKPANPSIPLVIVSPLELAKETVQHEAGGYDLLDHGLISHLRVDRIDSTIEYNDQLNESLGWLVSNRPAVPNIKLTEVKALLERYLTSTFYYKVYADLATRQQQDLVHMCPEELIAFFNETVLNFGEIICDETLEHFSWPVFEQKSKGLSLEECQYLLYERIQLPPFNQHREDDWYHTCKDVMAYLDTVIEHYHTPSHYSWLCQQPEAAAALHSNVKALLARTETIFTSRCEKQFHAPPHLEPLRQNVPWLHIIVACVEVALSVIDPQLLAMHRPYSEDLNATQEYPTGFEIPYKDTLILAMEAARSHDADNDYIDMDTSIYTEPVSLLGSNVCDELNASKQFEEFLSSQLEEASGFYEVEVVEPVTTVHNFSDPHTDIGDLIREECNEAKVFEEFLHRSLLEET